MSGSNGSGESLSCIDISVVLFILSDEQMARAKAARDQMKDIRSSAVKSRCSSSEYAHGGDVYRNEVSLDFSVNLNPLGVPQEVISAAVNGLDEVTQYPDPYHAELRNAIAAAENTDPDMIVCGNGASELIMAAVHAFMPRKALVTAPCYSGYETSLEAAGTEICHYYLDEKKDFTLDEGIMAYITEDIDMVFLTNPNNPNGRLIDDKLLQKIEHRCADCGTVLLLDECFLPLTGARTDSAYSASNGTVPDVSQVNGGILHLRAFTKTFAVPGIRLGYIFSSDTHLLNEIRLHLPEWNVSRAAEKAGAAACRLLTHTDYLDDAAMMIRTERTYLETELTALGIKVYPSDVNYILFRSEPGLYEKLLACGILIRRCANFKGLDETFYRIAVRKHADNEVLLDTLRADLRK